MSSSHSDSLSTSSVGSSHNGSLGDSLDSLKTEEHNELYDHRQHNDIISTQIENNNIQVDLQNAADSEVIMESDEEEDSNVRFVEHVVARDAQRSDGTPRQSAVMPSPTMRRTSFNALPSPAIKAKESPRTPEIAKPMKSAQPASHRRTSAEGVDPFTITHSGEYSAEDALNATSPKMKRRQSRAQSFSEKMQVKSGKTKTRTDSIASSHSLNPMTMLGRIGSRKSMENNLNKNVTEGAMPKSRRRESFDSDKSQASGESQETEEDVWFPLSPQLHTRINGIDFDELEEFAQQQKERDAMYLQAIANPGPNGAFANGVSTSACSSASVSISSNALKYTPRPSAQQQLQSSSSGEPDVIMQSEEDMDEKKKEAAGVSFGNNRIEGETFNEKPFNYETGQQRTNANGRPSAGLEFASDVRPFNGGAPYVVPDRFSFFNSFSEETVHSTDIPSLVSKGQSFYNLFKGGQPTWWLDCSCPTDDEMRCIAKAFGIHPLTAEDIRMQETREKVELFKSYYFVCFHTFENDKESEDFLEPINVYIVVFRTGVITFHFNPISHPGSVRRRVRQLRDYVDVNSDWICYALIDDITDSFAPVIQSIEYEADSIEDSVFMARDMDFSVMLQRIGESRRKTMTLMRLLSGKADVIKMFAKRCQDEQNGIGPALTSQINIANLQSNYNTAPTATYNPRGQRQPPHTMGQNQSLPSSANRTPADSTDDRLSSQPRAEIAMYLGDIQDHLLTMYQNLSAYEKIFSRSHSNYLAQLQVESFNSNNRVTEMLGKVTMIGTMLVPLNVITGLFGMNVHVPGEGVGGYGWWFGILGVLIFLGIVGYFMASYWVSRIGNPKTLNEAGASGSHSMISNFISRKSHSSNRDDPYASNRNTNRSVVSLPSKLSRYQ